MSLKDKLIAYLEDPKTLQDIYPAFRSVKPSTIRGRLNENIGKCFTRISRGVYLATNGDSQCVIIEGDAWDKIKDFEDESIDVIITDPPYSCLDHQMTVGSTRQRNLNRGWKFDTPDYDSELLSDFFRVLKPKGHFYTFLPAIAHDTADYNESVRKLAQDCGFYFHKVLIWDKGHIGMGYHFRNRHETIYFFSKGYVGAKDLPMTYAENGARLCLTKPDVLKHTRPHHTKKIHETEKPVQLLVDILEYCTEENAVALDPFGGSLTLALACVETNRNAIVIEKDRQMVRSGVRRIAEMVCAPNEAIASFMDQKHRYLVTVSTIDGEEEYEDKTIIKIDPEDLEGPYPSDLKILRTLIGDHIVSKPQRGEFQEQRLYEAEGDHRQYSVWDIEKIDKESDIQALEKHLGVFTIN